VPGRWEAVTLETTGGAAWANAPHPTNRHMQVFKEGIPTTLREANKPKVKKSLMAAGGSGAA
jgi:hypothetical protein